MAEGVPGVSEAGALSAVELTAFREAAAAWCRDVRYRDTSLEGFFAMAAGRLDGVVSTIDTMVLYLKTGKEFQYVLALDDSKGGDGLVARKEIKSVKDLKGKKVAFSEGSVSQFFLNVLLKEAGLTQKDVEAVNMKPEDAGAAFVAEKVDAAVTWEPWLSKGKSAPHGQLLVDSSKTPGLITDVLIFRSDVIAKRGKEIQGVVNAWNKAVAFWEKNKTEGNEIMARGVGDWLKTRRSSPLLDKVLQQGRQRKFAGQKRHVQSRRTHDIWGGFDKLQVKPAPGADQPLLRSKPACGARACGRPAGP
jgi:NitT/TauT family transport system substrate-binding protein